MSYNIAARPKPSRLTRRQRVGGKVLAAWLGSGGATKSTGKLELGITRPLPVQSDNPSLLNPVEVLKALSGDAAELSDLEEGSLIALASMQCGWQRNYFHWTVDLLPSLIEAYRFCRQRGRQLTVVVPSSTEQAYAPFIGRWLQLLDLQFGEAYKVEMNSSYGLKGAILFLRNGRIQLGDGGKPTVGISTNILNSIREASGATWPVKTTDKVFLLRGRGALRSSPEIPMKRLKELGFTPVDCFDLDIAEQWRIVGRASEVWAVHGAALTNLIWSKDCSVTELVTIKHSVIRRRSEYLEISRANGNQHRLRIVAFS